jgi:hypothetical protein
VEVATEVPAGGVEESHIWVGAFRRGSCVGR